MDASATRKIASLRETSARSALNVNLLASILTKLSGFAQLFLITHLAGLAAYGAWTLLNSLVTYVTMMVTLSLPNAFVRFHPTQPKALHYERAFTVLGLLASVVVSVPLLAVIPWLAGTFLKSSEYVPLLQAGLLLIPLNTARLFLSDCLRARGNSIAFAWVNIIYECLETGVLAVVLVLKQPLSTVIWVEVLFLAAAGWFAFRRVMAVGERAQLIPPQFREVAGRYLGYSLPLLPSAFLALLASNGDRFLVGYFLGAANLGLYNSLYAVASVIMVFNQPVTNVLFPRVVRQYAEGKLAAANREIFRACAGFMGVGLIALAGLAALGPWVLPQFLRLGSTSGAEGAGMASILMVALMIFGVTRIYSVHIFARSNTRLLLWAYGGGFLINLAANLVLIPVWGLTGAFLASLISYSVMAVVMWALVRLGKPLSRPRALPPQWQMHVPWFRKKKDR